VCFFWRPLPDRPPHFHWKKRHLFLKEEEEEEEEEEVITLRTTLKLHKTS